MNLKSTHVLPLFIGVSVGAAAGFVISFAFRAGLLPEFEAVIGLQYLGVMIGSIVGAVITILILMRSESRNLGSGMPHNFNSMNGMGSELIGEWDRGNDGSYLTTEWLTVLWIPVFPVCSYRVIKMAKPNLLYLKSYLVLEKHPVRLQHIGPGLARTLLAVAIVASVAWYLKGGVKGP